MRRTSARTAEKLSAFFSKDLPAFGMYLFRLVGNGPAPLKLRRRRGVELPSDRSGRPSQALIVAQPDRTGGERNHANRGHHAERHSIETYWNSSLVEHLNGCGLVTSPLRQKSSQLLPALILSNGSLGRLKNLGASLSRDRRGEIGKLLGL